MHFGKTLLKRIVINKYFAKIAIRPLLKIHNFSHKLSARYSTVLNNGIHPKHKIIKYKEWFLDNIKEGWNVLDIGCNTGMLTYLLSKKAKFVYGIELKEEHIKIAKKHRSKNNIVYLNIDATKYNYNTEQKIDCIILSNVLEHIENRNDFLNIIVQKVNWSKEKFIFIRVPLLTRDWITIYKKEIGVEYLLDSTHFIEYTLETLRNELEKSNIRILSHRIDFGEIYVKCKVENNI